MAEGCPEQLTLEFALWVWNYPRLSRPKIARLLREQCEGKQIVWLHSRAEVERFLETQGGNDGNKDGCADTC